MKKYYILSIIFVFVIVGCVVLYNNNLSTKTSEPFIVYEEDGYYISKYGKIAKKQWDSINHDNSGFENVEEFLLDVDYYVDAVSEYINRPNWKDVYKEKHGEDFEFKIKIGVAYGGASHVVGGYNHFKYLILGLELNSEFLESNHAPITHEITHLITPYYTSLSLREGLASFMQDTIGKNPAPFNYGKPIIPFSKEFLLEDNIEKNRAVIKNIGTEGIPKDMNITTSNMKKRKLFYILSYSFSKYLIDEYGIEKFMEVYESDDLYTKYEEVYEKKLAELHIDWINYVRAYEED